MLPFFFFSTNQTKLLKKSFRLSFVYCLIHLINCKTLHEVLELRAKRKQLQFFLLEVYKMKSAKLIWPIVPHRHKYHLKRPILLYLSYRQSCSVVAQTNNVRKSPNLVRLDSANEVPLDFRTTLGQNVRFFLELLNVVFPKLPLPTIVHSPEKVQELFSKVI